MNVPLYWIEQRCYRRNPNPNDEHRKLTRLKHPNQVGQLLKKTTKNTGEHGSSSTRNLPAYIEHDDLDECDPNGILHDDFELTNEEEMEYKIEEITGNYKNSGMLRLICNNIPNSLYGSIIGPKGSIKKRIESETETWIQIPRINEEGHVEIKGKSKENIIKARRRISAIVDEGRSRREPTHFACIPLNSSIIIKNVRDFHEKLIKEFKGEGLNIDESVFQEPEKIHLTICMLTLLDQSERENISKLMEQEIKSYVLEKLQGKTIRCRLQGLDIMNDDPTQASVLFAKCQFADSQQIIQEVADFIHRRFKNTGFAKLKGKGSDNVKFHATLLNARFRQFRNDDTNISNEQGNGGWNRRQRYYISPYFNVKPVLDKYGDYDFGFVQLNEIHVSTRHTKGSDGFYKATVKISLK